MFTLENNDKAREQLGLPNDYVIICIGPAEMLPPEFRQVTLLSLISNERKTGVINLSQTEVMH